MEGRWRVRRREGGREEGEGEGKEGGREGKGQEGKRGEQIPGRRFFSLSASNRTCSNIDCTFRLVSSEPDARTSPKRWKSTLHTAAL